MIEDIDIDNDSVAGHTRSSLKDFRIAKDWYSEMGDDSNHENDKFDMEAIPEIEKAGNGTIAYTKEIDKSVKHFFDPFSFGLRTR